MSTVDSFGAKSTLTVGSTDYEIFRIDTVDGYEKLPFSLKVLLENLLRTEDGANVTKEQIEALGSWDAAAEPDTEIQFTPARVVMQDFTGVPCIVDLATMREAVAALGGDPTKINPLSPAEMVIDHSVIADLFGTENALERNVEIEYERNGERYQFLRWGQTAFDDFKVVPPGTGIVHQVNIEHLAKVIYDRTVDGVLRAYPDTCVGTDSHTTMVNGLGVLGWGVGGIEAEAAMLGQPVSMLIPKVVGFKLSGAIPTGVTATDVVLTITEMLRKHGVVGKFVEFYGSGVASVPLANRATIGNMSPEFGSTAAMFPIDDVTLDYLRLTGRSDEQVALVEAYAKVQTLWHDADSEPVVQRVPRARPLDGRAVDRRPEAPAGPHHPVQREGRSSRATSRTTPTSSTIWSTSRAPSRSRHPTRPETRPTTSTAHHAHHHHSHAPATASKPTPVALADGEKFTLDHGAVTIAAITSCTNTSNPSVMLAAGLLARNAVEEGPQGQAVGQDHARAGLEGRHRLLREGRPHRGPRGPRLLHGRLRLHDLHRQLRPAHRGGLGGGQRERPRRHRGALGQPQLRGSHQPRREDELPREPAARDRVLARRVDELRLRDRRARQGPGRQRRVPAGHLARRGRGAGDDRLVDQQGHVHAPVRERLRGRRAVAHPADADRRRVRVGRRSRPTCASPRTSTA